MPRHFRGHVKPIVIKEERQLLYLHSVERRRREIELSPVLHLTIDEVVDTIATAE